MVIQTATNLSNTAAADVVVIGAGPGGLSAGITAAEMGNSVIILEKSPELGGNLALSPRVISTAALPKTNTDGISVDSGVNPDDNSIQRHILHRSDNLDSTSSPERNGVLDNQGALAALYSHNIKLTWSWLSKMGLVFFPLTYATSSTAPQSQVSLPNSGSYLRQMVKEINQKQIRVFTDARAIGLSTLNGRVNGVEVDFLYQDRELDPDRDVLVIKAARGVVIATGDFSSNASLKHQLLDGTSAYVSGVNPSSTGDGHIMARQLGGVIRNAGGVWGPELRFSHYDHLPKVHQPPRWFKSTALRRLCMWCLPKVLFHRAMMSSLIESTTPSLAAVEYGAKLIDDGGAGR
ncbi:MAG: FAD-binding protein [Gammaproteobacteria bacterium]|nr:FAD-binding protein [Gammaproteobacteria bacterium]